MGVSACSLNYFANSFGSTVVCFLSGITDCGMDVAMNHLIHNTRTAHHGVKFSPLPCHLEHCIWEAGEKPLLFSSISLLEQLLHPGMKRAVTFLRSHKEEKKPRNSLSVVSRR